jgi:hypothetical protein
MENISFKKKSTLGDSVFCNVCETCYFEVKYVEHMGKRETLTKFCSEYVGRLRVDVKCGVKTWGKVKTSS